MSHFKPNLIISHFTLQINTLQINLLPVPWKLYSPCTGIVSLLNSSKCSIMVASAIKIIVALGRVILLDYKLHCPPTRIGKAEAIWSFSFHCTVKIPRGPWSSKWTSVLCKGAWGGRTQIATENMPPRCHASISEDFLHKIVAMHMVVTLLFPKAYGCTK